MSFDRNANPESIAARAAELALEQHDRLRIFLENHTPQEGNKFYGEPFESMISNQIASLMGSYAVLKGYVTEERAHIKPEDTVN